MTTASAAPALPFSPDRYSTPRLLLVAACFVGAGASLLVEPVVAPVLLLFPTLLVIGERTARDAVSVLTVMVLAMVLIPSGSVVGSFGSAGRPAGLIGIVALWWWAHARLLLDGGVDRAFQPVRVSTGLFVASVTASYAAAFVRPILPVEASAADRGVMLLLGLVGALLLSADGISDRARLEVLLRRVVLAGTFLAVVGILQFFTKVNLDAFFDIPGLQEQAELQAIQNRSDFNRVSATASHPIEFGVALGMIFPLAVHFALVSRRRANWVQVAVIAAAVPMSVSRSGTLAIAVGALVLWLSWPSAQKLRAVGLAMAFAAVMRLLVPGLLGTIRSLFTSWFVDDSIKGRTDDYPLVGSYLADAPIFGRGFGTFIPELYIFLDNQYLGLLVETGALGTLLFIGILGTGYATARGSRRFADAETRSLGQALAAAILAGAVSAGTFDLLGFGIASGFLFLFIGCAGALWRLTAPNRRLTEASAQGGPTGWPVLGPS